VLEAFGFFVRARPFEADHVGKQFFGEPMAKDQVLGDFLPFEESSMCPVRRTRR